ncbi:iron-binding protein [Pelomonas sp. HMWF004]|nr:iron-binding protein [Pelomonas sp. HMWF004]
MNKITISLNGPYLVRGTMPLAHQHIVTNAQGESIAWQEGEAVAAPAPGPYALCRCGQSATKPFCDGAHQRVGFDGTETASREPYDVQAKHIEGPTLVLDDAEALCAFARFCDPKGQVWHLVQSSDPPAARLVEQQAGDCPGGRLRARQRAQAQSGGHDIEPHFEPSIGLVQDTAKGVSGPLWVRGGVDVFSADGSAYEVRNRVALCRCGASGNKPFCDGSHVASGFNDAN